MGVHGPLHSWLPGPVSLAPDAGISVKGCDRDAGLAAVPDAARTE